jgi:hypothetical protein
MVRLSLRLALLTIEREGGAFFWVSFGLREMDMFGVIRFQL